MPFAIGFLNCYNRTDAVREAINVLSSKTENWILGVTEPNFNLIGYEIASKSGAIFTSFNRNKAAIITSSNDWHVYWAPDDIDLICVKSNAKFKNLIVTCIYITGNTKLVNINLFTSIANSYHAFLRANRSAQHVLVGDFNCRSKLWSYEKSDRTGNILGNFLIHLRMESVVKPNPSSWTRFDLTTGRESWIDAILVTIKLQKDIFHSEVIDTEYSDHRMIYCLMKNFKSSCYINFKKMNEIAEKLDLSSLDRLPNTSKEADESLQRIEEVMIKLNLDSYEEAKRKIKTIISEEMTKINRAGWLRLRKFRKWKKLNSNTIPKLSKLARNVIDEFNIKSISKIAKRNQEKVSLKKAKAMEEKRGPWWTIHKIMGKSYLQSTGDMNAYPSEKPDIPPEKIQDEYIMNPIISSPNRDLNIIFDFSKLLTTRDLLEICEKATKKSCLYDENINCISLKYLLSHHRSIILHLVAYTIACGHFPAALKKAKICLIPKKDPTKLRPLSILHPLYRLGDAILFQILDKLVDKELLQYQYAFLNNTNALDMHLILKNHIEQMQSDGRPLALIIIDLSDAFEGISFNAIKLGLTEMGIDSEFIKILIAYILNRQSYFDGPKGRCWKTHSSGAPQGGFLSPMLFIIGLRLIWKLADYGFRIYAYADDICILVQGDILDTIRWMHVSQKLDNLCLLLGRLNLRVNEEKTKILYLESQQWSRDVLPITLNGQIMKPTEKANLLGFDVDDRLQFKENCLKKKVQLLSDLITPYSSRIRSLRLPNIKILLTSQIMGCCLYYGGIQCIWESPTTFQKKCGDTMEIIGKLIKHCLGLKLTSSNITAYYIIFYNHLASIIEKHVSDQLLKIRKLKRELPRYTRSRFDPYGVNILSLPYEIVHYQKVKSRMFNETDEEHKFIRYHRISQKYDLWFKLEWGDEDTTSFKKTYRYWIFNQSYLECLEDAIFRFITENKELYMDNQIWIEADKGLINRVKNPIKWSRLSLLIQKKRYSIVFYPRDPRRFRPSRNDERTIERTVVEFSTQYWRLKNMYNHLFEAEKWASNITRSCLHFSQFKIFRDWDKLWRIDLHSLILLCGGWHSQELMDECPQCGRKIDTQNLLFGCCSFLDTPKVKRLQVNLKNYAYFISQIFAYRAIVTNFRRNLSKITLKNI